MANWMKNAVKKKGALKAAAMRSGESTQQFAEGHKDAPRKVGKRSRLALTFAKYRPK